MSGGIRTAACPAGRGDGYGIAGRRGREIRVVDCRTGQTVARLPVPDRGRRRMLRWADELVEMMVEGGGGGER